jgi:hypothetical protein
LADILVSLLSLEKYKTAGSLKFLRPKDKYGMAGEEKHWQKKATPGVAYVAFFAAS